MLSSAVPLCCAFALCLCAVLLPVLPTPFALCLCGCAFALCFCLFCPRLCAVPTLLPRSIAVMLCHSAANC